MPSDVWRYQGAAFAIRDRRAEAIEAYDRALSACDPEFRLAIEQELRRLR